MRVEVQAAGYDTAAAALVGANQRAAIAYHDLRSELSGYRALGGDDASSADFVRAYDAGAREAVAAVAALVAGLGALGEVTSGSARNHRRANAASIYGHGASYDGGSPGHGPVTVTAFTPPTALGGDNTDTPDWWNHVVDHLQGYGWPSANTGQLRSAASAWRTAAGAVGGLADDLATAESHLEQQRSPEIGVATQVLGRTRTDVVALASCLRELGAACEDYAQQVEDTRDTIRGLLQDLALECGLAAGFGLALSFVTFGGAAVVGTGVIGVRAVKYARLVLAALRGLQAARAVGIASAASPRLANVMVHLQRIATARATVASFRATQKGSTVSRAALNTRQASNLRRYEKSLPRGSQGTVVTKHADGGVSYSATVPGRVPGSSADYIKTVDGLGETTAYLKSTYGPDGALIHIKDKMAP